MFIIKKITTEKLICILLLALAVAGCDSPKNENHRALNRFQQIDGKLHEFAKKIYAVVANNKGGYTINGREVPADKIEIRSISWQDSGVGKSIMIQPVFDSINFDAPTWNVTNLAWVKDGVLNTGRSSWTCLVLEETNFETVEKNIDQLLEKSLENLGPIKITGKSAAIANTSTVKEASGQVHETVRVESVKEEPDFGPPPFGPVSKFPTIDAWMTAVCKGDQPKKPIETYKFGIFESSTECVLFVLGENMYENGNRQTVKNEFTPSESYFQLPESYWHGLARPELFKKVFRDLKAFSGTDQFKHSFFPKAESLVFTTTGKTIWSKYQLQLQDHENK